MTRFQPHSIIIVILVLASQRAFSQQGKDGAKTIAANAVVNEYTSLQADADSGVTIIEVANNNLNFNNRFGGPLDSGDLVMIIQVQGATISGNNDSTWGSIISYNNCGAYEFAEVAGLTDTDTISFLCPLKNSYTATGNTEVIRVPRYTSLTINASDTLTGDFWNGTTGGIISVEVQGNILLNAGSVINATGIGFRGGIIRNQWGPVFVTYGYVFTDSALGGQKGEGIGGYYDEDNWLGGMFGRGPAANGGGGGNAWNCPGGGGANAGDINLWTGNGNPDTSKANWITAWNLEAPGFANSSSAGGGRGGYASVDTILNPLIYGPNNVVWSDQTYRSNAGGKGGRPLDYSTGRIFFGGGGGAAHEDNNKGGSGGNGGGVVYLFCNGTITGNGVIISNGTVGGNDVQGSTSFSDAPGGGGAGGTAILKAGGTISGISVSADGAAGGNQQVNFGYDESAGGGGGGGGGYIAVTNGNIARQALGGANGTTNALSMIKFPPDGGTKGASGLANETIAFTNSITGENAGTLIALKDTICAGQNGQLTLVGDTGAAVWQYATTPGNFAVIDSVEDATYTSPALYQTTYYQVMNGAGNCAAISNTVTITVAPLPWATLAAADSLICASDSTEIQASGNFTTCIWNTGDTGNFIYAKNAGNYWVTVTDFSGCTAQSAHLPISVYPVPSVSVIVQGDTLTSFNAVAYQWYLNGNKIPGATAPVYIANQEGGYSVEITDSNGCTALSNSVEVVITSAVNLVNSSALTVYPNPASGLIYITGAVQQGEINCTVLDLSGRKVIEERLSPYGVSTAQLDISSLSSGVYILELRSGGQLQIQKVVVDEK